MDFRPSFSRPCGEEDYSSWDLTNLQVGQGAGWGAAPGRPTSTHRSPHAEGAPSSKKPSWNADCL